MLASSVLMVALSSPALLQTPVLRALRTDQGNCGSSVVMRDAPRGFGKVPPKADKPKPVKKSAAAVARDKAGEDFERLKQGGAPEYMVLIRTVDSQGQPSKWYPVGGIAVPRSSSEDQAL